ncbi:Metallo-hydrolase/oxidoreductase [Aspergillus sclerotioniger CBS 115572]|uniref:Metallo-hydrolase/oxidoreductase n=1 Tax=Aspergillus sclerotioniger CBS 115572 TaxID=1450535 RepID=A0A317XBP2_9EURO|nr:Metallo-hydrolase/oxidoreductase [Aspergillus sclerotioniger CBS 115572]PWY95996.1 Metallo-hydrolase/oxidoreductase [Aspergillus sclerotioniger CBS 115572]
MATSNTNSKSPCDILTIDPSASQPPTRNHHHPIPTNLPKAKVTKTHPSTLAEENASVYFIGNATTIIQWHGIRIMTDPNFLHAGDHVHLGPGVTSMRRKNPAVDLENLPPVDLVLLSHYHEDHFDRHVEASLRRDLPIVTTPHAKLNLTAKGEDSFTKVTAVDVYNHAIVDIKSDETSRQPRLRVTGMPGKHIPMGKPLEKLNDIVGAIPPTNGWMLELGYSDQSTEFQSGYRIYISGDTLVFDELKEIPRRYGDQAINLMLIHLGGTTVPSPAMLPLAMMVTMDAKQGVELMRLIRPQVTIPVHFDDYDVMASSLEDFQAQVKEAGLDEEVVYLERGDEFRFCVGGERV